MNRTAPLVMAACAALLAPRAPGAEGVPMDMAGPVRARCDDPAGASLVRVVVVRGWARSQHATAAAAFTAHLTDVRGTLLQVIEVLLDEGHEAVVARIGDVCPALTVAVGDAAARFVRRNLPRLPAVFLLVRDRDAAGVAHDGQRGLTGVLLRLSPALQVDVVRRTLPRIRRVGTLCGGPATCALAREIAEAGRARDLVVEIAHVRSGGASRAAVVRMRPRVDALWLLPDRIAGHASLILYALRWRIPTITFEPRFMRRGAVLSVSPDFVDQGRQAAVLAARVLDGAPPTALPVEWPRKPFVAINRPAAALTRVALATDALDAADEVVP